MRYRVLGGLEVVDGSRPLDLGGPKQRAVLAALLVDAGRTITIDRLIDAVWGDHPPPRGRRRSRPTCPTSGVCWNPLGRRGLSRPCS